MDDDLQARSDAVDAEMAKFEEEWNTSKLPPIGLSYRFNDMEWMHHIHMTAQEQILIDKLGITKEEVEIYVKETFIKEGRNWMDILRKQRREAIRAGIVPPGGGIFKP